MMRIGRGGWVALAATAIAACTPARPCDPGQRYDHGLCYAPDAPPAPAPFGAACGVDADCPAPTDFCAPALAGAAHYCTRAGCLADPSSCPAGWACFDFSVILPGYPSLCAQP